MNEDGYVGVIGRITEMIIRGWENIYPTEIEDLLDQHPDIASAQVVRVPHDWYGEEVVAWIKLLAGTTMNADDVRRYCSARLATTRCPCMCSSSQPPRTFP